MAHTPQHQAPVTAGAIEGWVPALVAILLTETKAPADYLTAANLHISVSDSSGMLRMACTTAKTNGSTQPIACTGAGTKEDPFIVADPPAITTMPATGGRLGPIVLAVSAGSLLLLLLVSGWILLRPRERKH